LKRSENPGQTSDDIQDARQLLDHLMEVTLDPVSRALTNAPFEDEEVSEGAEQAVARSKEALKHTPVFLLSR
jgi:hypothetical protein